MATGKFPKANDERIEVPLSSTDTLAVNSLGQLAEHPRVVALRNFIIGWHVSYFSTEDARGQPKAGPEERLSKTGDNLANVIQYLSEEHPELLQGIFERLRTRVPKIQEVATDQMPDGRLLLQLQDAPCWRSIWRVRHTGSNSLSTAHPGPAVFPNFTPSTSRGMLCMPSGLFAKPSVRQSMQCAVPLVAEEDPDRFALPTVHDLNKITP